MATTTNDAKYVVTLDPPVCICDSLRAVLRDRERELLQLKGPCSNGACPLHYAHSGPCDGRKAP